MFLFYFSMGLTVVSNAAYHIVQKLTPGTANPPLSLAVTYATATLVCLALLPFFPIQAGLAASLRGLNWTSFALAFAIAGLELGFLLAYRAGWNISRGAIVSNVAVAILLVPIGLLLFKEQLSAARVIGLVLCVAGLALINQR
jgi:drug/metabolite transporter (DMT)-like permease